MGIHDEPFRDYPKKRKPPLQVVNGGSQSTGQVQPPIWINGQELADKVFPPIRWVVPGLIPEGLTLLAGRLKLGKSWLMMNIAIAIGLGGMALSTITCPEGDVLYLALEDNERRLKERQANLTTEGFHPRRVYWATKWPRLDLGGIGFIEKWITEVEKPRLVVIDILKRMRRPREKDEGMYDYDYSSAEPLHELAHKHQLAIVLVHHLNKRTDGDDPLDFISGSNGLAACADTILILNRSSQGTTLYGRGRDVSEFDKALTLGTQGIWRLLGDTSDVSGSEQRANIQAFIANNDSDASISEISAATGYKTGNVRFLLNKMIKDGQIMRKTRGKYGPLPNIHR